MQGLKSLFVLLALLIAPLHAQTVPQTGQAALQIQIVNAVRPMNPDFIPPPPDLQKDDFGWYWDSNTSDSFALGTKTLCEVPGWEGMRFREHWRYSNPSQGGYDWAALFAILDAARLSNDPTCKIFLHWAWKNFQGETNNANHPGNRNPCPPWLVDETGRPGSGFVATVDSAKTSSSVVPSWQVTAATNTNPITITVGTAHAMSGATEVFLWDVQGNTAANGSWTVTPTGTFTFQLTTRLDIPAVSRAGNGAFHNQIGDSGYSGLGPKAIKNPIYACKMWSPLVAQRFNEFITAMSLVTYQGELLDNYAFFEGMFWTETAIGAGATGNGTYRTDDYNAQTYAENYRDMMLHAATVFPKSRQVSSLNFLGADGTVGGASQALIRTLIQPALMNFPNNTICFGQPDVLPLSSNFWSGNNQPYNVELHWNGCRTNSIENNSYDQAGWDMDHIATFSFRGTYGVNIPAGAIGVNDTTKGICINSFLFANHTVTTSSQGRDWNDMKPVALAHPYGPDWYSRCNGGGARPN